MKIYILNNNTELGENSTLESYKVNKKNLAGLILTIKVIVALLYAFGLGYSLFFFGEDYIKVGLRFLCLLILAYIFIDFPLSFLKALLLPKTFDKDKIILSLNPYNLSIDICSNIKISKMSVILSFILPFIFLSIIPTVLSYKLEFNIYLYVLGTVSAIIGTKDLIYSLLILKNYSLGSTIKLTPDEFIFYN
ncbi:DUF3267 domain-containing protein [Clostridium sp. Sa3CUN1]|uniref:DUF3267 domain-containing protein n=1 Tax=Clostridium gallinarum TaxID=2762246 RepID=A0ABR8Q4L1_9CLOT|nr:metalloprotease family protein [Clostridium gallinarum]MBD7915340.1 DUF3267 domain-containing protein [Clostridium gallinarum]